MPHNREFFGARGKVTGFPDTALRRAPSLSDEVVAAPSGARQAGADRVEGPQIKEWRSRAEKSLYFFARGVLNCWWLIPQLHKPMCAWMQRVPPRRKMLMVPREHGKTTLAGQCLPLHMWIQPKDGNIYFPDMLGTATRILMAGEKIDRASDHVRVVQHHLTNNDTLKTLWPHVAWKNPKREARVWNNNEMCIPREREFPDPSMRAIGIGGAITGAHPNVLIKDDLTTDEAANSPVVMQSAIEWHKNSRALISSYESTLEFITCTRWAPGDLPEYIMTNDPTVEVNELWRAMSLPDGELIYPRTVTEQGSCGFTHDGMLDLQRTFGPRFHLLYRNTTQDSQLVDFDPEDIRRYTRGDGGEFVFTEDERDAAMATALNAPAAKRIDLRGRSLYDDVTREALRGRVLRRDHYA